MSERELSEKTDLFLKGQLKGEALSDFRDMIQKDPVLAARVKEQMVLLEKLRYYAQRKELKKTLDIFHNELREEVKKPKRRFINITRSAMTIAASVTAILLIGASFYMGVMYSSEKKQLSEYLMLSKEMKKIEQAQHAIIKDLNASKSAPSAAQAQYSGTGFLISSEGYILTSLHLIKNADSVFVENSKTGRIKVQKIYKGIHHDIALLKIDEDQSKELGKIPFMLKKREAELGEKVFTLGFPREDIVYGEGSVSSASGYEGDTLAYQISIPLNPGNSGGPLLDEQGNLIGIISGKNTGQEASSYAIKSEYIREFLSKDEETEIQIPSKNSIAFMKRSEQVKKLKPFIFNIRVY